MWCIKCSAQTFHSVTSLRQATVSLSQLLGYLVPTPRTVDSTCSSCIQQSSYDCMCLGVHCQHTYHTAHNVSRNILYRFTAVQVRMHVHGWCKMGISFWPSFRFKSPDRDEEVCKATTKASSGLAARHSMECAASQACACAGVPGWHNVKPA